MQKIRHSRNDENSYYYEPSGLWIIGVSTIGNENSLKIQKNYNTIITWNLHVAAAARLFKVNGLGLKEFFRDWNGSLASNESTGTERTISLGSAICIRSRTFLRLASFCSSFLSNVYFHFPSGSSSSVLLALLNTTLFCTQFVYQARSLLCGILFKENTRLPLIINRIQCPPFTIPHLNSSPHHASNAIMGRRA